MTPQERDLITALFTRVQQQGGQPKDAEADALIRQAMAALPDASYLLVQTVLIQDMALHSAQDRLTQLEQQVAAKPAAPPPASFLAGAGHGSVPTAGPWQRAAPTPPTAAPVWTQSAGAAAAPAPSAPQMLSGSGSGFLRQAAATAAGIAGGALLFEGIQSLFGPHYGGGFLAGMPAQPSLSETVVNNYYGDGSAKTAADAAFDQGGDTDQTADADDLSGQDQDMADTDIADAGDVGGDGGDFGA